MVAACVDRDRNEWAPGLVQFEHFFIWSTSDLLQRNFYVMMERQTKILVLWI